MGFRLHKGRVKTVYYDVKAEQELLEGALVKADSGELVPGTSDDDAETLLGVTRHAVESLASGDDRRVGIHVPLDEDTEWEFETTGLVAGDVGLLVDLDASDSVNRGASVKDVVRVTKRISSTRGIGVLRIG